MTATPVVPGATGSEQFTTDQTSVITSRLLTNSGQIPVDVFFLGREKITKAQHSIEPHITDQQANADTDKTHNAKYVFSQLDPNGSGFVSWSRIQSFSATNPILADFFSSLKDKYALGAGGENVAALPGVTLESMLGGSVKCAKDVTASLSEDVSVPVKVGLIYQGTVGLTNGGENPVGGPLQLVLPYNTTEVALINATGVTSCSSVGRPYIFLPLQGNQLGAGQSLQVTVSVNIPSGDLPTNVVPQVLGGLGAP